MLDVAALSCTTAGSDAGIALLGPPGKGSLLWSCVLMTTISMYELMEICHVYLKYFRRDR